MMFLPWRDYSFLFDEDDIGSSQGLSVTNTLDLLHFSFVGRHPEPRGERDGGPVQGDGGGGVHRGAPHV